MSKPSARAALRDTIETQLLPVDQADYPYAEARLSALLLHIKAKRPIEVAAWLHRLEDRIEHLSIEVSRLEDQLRHE